MTVSYRTGIAILQFIFFLPSLFLGLYLCFRPGKRAISTWRTVTTLSALRVAGDISYFISLSKPSVNVYVAVVVCELVGIAPLMLTLVAFVGRVLVFEAHVIAAFMSGSSNLATHEQKPEYLYHPAKGVPSHQRPLLDRAYSRHSRHQ